MDLVDKIKNTTNYKYESNECFIHGNILHLSYPEWSKSNNLDFLKNLDKEILYTNMFDTLDLYFNIYNTIETVYFTTDSFFSLPNVFTKFSKLLKIYLDGSRMWNLSCNQIPKTIQELSVVEAWCNLNPQLFTNGLDELLNLHRLDL